MRSRRSPSNPADAPLVPSEPSAAALPTLLEDIAGAEPSTSRTLVAPTGRTVELRTAGEVDQITVRAPGGALLLRFAVDDDGPILQVEGARIELAATKVLALEAEEISIAGRRGIQMHTEGELRADVGGDHHTSIGGQQRLEASAIEMQATADAGVQVRARGRIALDGEHIGLNDDPCPAPFEWSRQPTCAGTPEDDDE